MNDDDGTLNRSGHIMMYVYSSGSTAYFLDEMSLKNKNLFTYTWNSKGYFVYNGFSGTYNMGYYEPLT